jgi:endogenous inhibitor of DNA gyrase (YacG/DUF329 family)
MIDLGAWADEEYAIPAESSDVSDEDVAALEKAMEE